MDESAYKKHLLLDKHHFWRKAKRRLALAWLERYASDQRPLRILDIGSACSLLPLEMADYGEVVAVDPHEASVEMAKDELGIDARVGSLPNDLPVDDKFDMITMFDVLEHIVDEEEALERVKSLLQEDGILLMTVPAYQWLYSNHDKILQHCRRYSRRRLERQLNASGFTIERISYYTCLLFPFALVVRLVGLLRKSRPNEYNVKIPWWPVNQLFGFVMRIEFFCMRVISMPFGLSLMAVAKK